MKLSTVVVFLVAVASSSATRTGSLRSLSQTRQLETEDEKMLKHLEDDLDEIDKLIDEDTEEKNNFADKKLQLMEKISSAKGNMDAIKKEMANDMDSIEADWAALMESFGNCQTKLADAKRDVHVLDEILKEGFNAMKDGVEDIQKSHDALAKQEVEVDKLQAQIRELSHKIFNL